MENKDKCCEVCNCNVDLLFQLENLNCNKWCRHLNIPLIKEAETVCDNFKLKRRNGTNSWNFRKVGVKSAEER